MGARFLERDDVVRRLNNTFCLYKEKPYFVTVGIEDNNDLVRIHEIPKYTTERRGRAVDYTSDDFKYTGLELGYMNFEGGAYYLARRPSRIQTSSLCTSTIFNKSLYIADHVFTAYFENCLLGKHPTFKEAVNSVRNVNGQGCAFDRDFAVKRIDKSQTLGVYFKDSLVGHVDKETIMLFGLPNTTFILQLLKDKGLL